MSMEKNQSQNKSNFAFNFKFCVLWLFALIGRCAFVSGILWGKNTMPTQKPNELPRGFMYVKYACYSVEVKLAYATTLNFMGRVLPGYKKKSAGILTRKAAKQIARVQDYLSYMGLGLRIYDAYRPQDAIIAFKNWTLSPEDFSTKERFYPNIDKSKLYELKYFNEESDHNRGSTVDLTIVDLTDLTELYMGTNFDFLDELSHTASTNVPIEAKLNRIILNHTMKLYGFTNYDKEWWHYHLDNEPIPKSSISKPFNFPVE